MREKFVQDTRENNVLPYYILTLRLIGEIENCLLLCMCVLLRRISTGPVDKHTGGGLRGAHEGNKYSREYAVAFSLYIPRGINRVCSVHGGYLQRVHVWHM